MYDYVSSFNEGYAIVKKDKKYGYVRRDGKLVIDCIFDSATEVKDGVACYIGEYPYSGYSSKVHEEGTYIRNEIINFAGYSHCNDMDIQYDNKVSSKINLIDLLVTRDSDIKNYKLVKDIIMKFTPKYQEFPVVLNLETFTLLFVSEYELNEVSKDTFKFMKKLKSRKTEERY